MSLKWLNIVWNNSKQKGGDLLGLMAIADEANDEGIARPNIKNIAYKMRMNSRTAIRVIGKVSKCDELAVAVNPGYRSTYCILTGRAIDEIETIKGWIKQLPTTPDKMSPPPPRQIVTPDKMSTRFLINSLNIKDSNKLIKSSSSSYDEDDEFYKMLKAAGVWKRDIQAIRTSDISLSDFMAELSRCYEDPKIRKPARVSVMNLLRGDRPSATWYEKNTWLSSIPHEVLKAGYPLLLEQDKSYDTDTHSDYTQDENKVINNAQKVFNRSGIELKVLSASEQDHTKACVISVSKDLPQDRIEYLYRFASQADYQIKEVIVEH